MIWITYEYSREHQADLKRWQLSLATTGSGIPIGLQLLAGNASLRQQVEKVLFQFRMYREEEPIYCADSGMYSEANMTALSGKHVREVSRVPETSSHAQAVVAQEPHRWQGAEDIKWYTIPVAVGRAYRKLDRGAKCRWIDPVSGDASTTRHQGSRHLDKTRADAGPTHIPHA